MPAEVFATQFGESLRLHSVALVPAFASFAENPPECPPETRVRVMPVPAAFQPEVLVSKPGLPTRLPLAGVAVGDAFGVGIGVEVPDGVGVELPEGVGVAVRVGVRVGVEVGV